MRKEIKASFNFGHFYYHNENYNWTNEMPHFWFSFFKIDGSTCRLNGFLNLEGNATIYSSFKKIESLNNIKPDKQDFLRIDERLGLQKIELKPIPVSSFVSKNGIKEPDSFMGCIAVLMNEECVVSDEKNIYPEILKSTIQKSLNRLVPLIQKNKNIVNNHLDDLKREIETVVVQESKKNQNFWEKLTTENIVDATIWNFSSDELFDMNSLSLVKHWGTEGVWELSGEVKVNHTRKKIKNRKIQTY